MGERFEVCDRRGSGQPPHASGTGSATPFDVSLGRRAQRVRVAAATRRGRARRPHRARPRYLGSPVTASRMRDAALSRRDPSGVAHPTVDVFRCVERDWAVVAAGLEPAHGAVLAAVESSVWPRSLARIDQHDRSREPRARLLKADRAGIRGADRSRGKNLSRRQPNATGRCHHDVAGRDEDVPLEGGRIRLFRRAAPERRKSESNNRQRSRSSPECSGVAG